jgi:hypothetical protein
MSKPLPLHSATISYRTPAGRRVLCGDVVAAPDAATCEERLRERIMSQQRFGRRRIDCFLDDFRSVAFATQIATPVRAVTA